MFQFANFNGDLSKWDVKSVTTMQQSAFSITNVLPMLIKFLFLTFVSLFHFLVFYGATKFNTDISKWDVGAVMNMDYSTLQSDLPSKRSTILTMFLLH